MIPILKGQTYCLKSELTLGVLFIQLTFKL